MRQLDFHNKNAEKNFSILFEIKSCYKIWCNFLNKIPRHIRYGFAIKIDNLFTDILEIALLAKFAKTEEKIIKLNAIDRKLCALKEFVTILWEIKAIDVHKYGLLSEKLTLVGNMIGKFFKNRKNNTNKDGN